MRRHHPPATRSRMVEVDALRGAALLGICVVNVPFLAGVDTFSPAEALGDRVAGRIVELLFQGKFFILFSFLFGWGFAIQLASAEKKLRNIHRMYLRRLAGLFVFGVAHALLVFTGDILVLYSILGIVLLSLRTATPRRLLQIAVLLIGVAFFSLCFLGIVLSELAEVSYDPSGYLGTFADAARQRLVEWPYAFGFVFLFNGASAFAAFCAGLAAAKVGFFQRGASSYTALKRSWLPMLSLGLVLNAGYMLSVEGVLGEGLFALFAFAGLAVGGPCLACLYLVGVVELVRGGGLTSAIAPGRMSLTAYIAEGVLAGLIFNGYGLGYYGRAGALACLLTAVGIYTAVHLLSVAWLKWQNHGPLEAGLRLVTHGFASRPSPSNLGGQSR